MIKEFIKNNKLATCSMLLYAIITLARLFTHTPWFDEAHAYTIAEQLNFIDIIKYVKNEGHFFLWQTLLLPFAKLHLYPYPMLILNWLFCTLALILMWWKCPLDNRIKVLITFSSPIIWCYSLIARCYSVGILLLFLLAFLYDKKLQYPKTYAFLLILSANTSLVALFGTTAFGILFLYDLFKSKNTDLKNNIVIASILSFGAILIIYQLLNIGYWDSTVGHRTLHLSVKIFRNTFVYNRLLPNLMFLGLFAVPIFKYFWQNKKVLFFYTFSSFFLLVLATGVYPCHYWHTYFFYIFLIIAFWLMGDENITGNLKRNALISFGIMSFVLVFHTPQMPNYSFIYKSYTKDLLKFIENDIYLKNAQIIQNDGLIYEMSPYSYGKSFKIKNYCHVEDNTEYDLWNISTQICPIENAMWQARKHPDILRKIVDDNTYTYIKESKLETINKKVLINTQNGDFLFEKYNCFKEYCFWKITVK